jgi:hypothetical protein
MMHIFVLRRSRSRSKTTRFSSSRIVIITHHPSPITIIIIVIVKDNEDYTPEKSIGRVFSSFVNMQLFNFFIEV